MANATMTIATQALNKLAQVHGVGTKAEVRDFGATQAVIVVSDELAERMAGAVAEYEKLGKKLKGMLPTWRKIGDVLVEYRTLFGDNDRAFGKAIATTPLAAISRQDRADLMILANRWDDIAAYRKDGKITSFSVGVIVKQLRDADKPEAEVKPERTAAGKSDAPSMSMDEERDELAAEEQAKSAKLADLSEADYAQMVADTAIKAGMDLGELIKSLQKIAKAQK